MDNGFKNWKAMVFAGLTAAVALPLAVGANAALDSGSFTVKSVNSEDSSIVAYAGVEPRSANPGNGGNEGGNNTPPQLPEPTVDSIMVSNWITSGETCKTVSLPMYNVNTKGTIDWGDGTVTEASDYPSHSYADSVDTATITVNTTFGGWGMADEDSEANGNPGYLANENHWAAKQSVANCLTSVGEWKETGTTSLSYAFWGSQKLTAVPQVPETNRSLHSAFMESNFDGDISGWDVSNVTNMSHMLFGNGSFNKPLNNWNVSNVKNMRLAFSRTISFDQPLDQWNVSKVTLADGMFEWSGINQDLSSWSFPNLEGRSDGVGLESTPMADKTELWPKY